MWEIECQKSEREKLGNLNTNRARVRAHSSTQQEYSGNRRGDHQKHTHHVLVGPKPRLRGLQPRAQDELWGGNCRWDGRRNGRGKRSGNRLN